MVLRSRPFLREDFADIIMLRFCSVQRNATANDFFQAEEILEQRIRYARQTGQTHLHVIVGKGNHSPNHIQKIKPRVEQVCRELGLQYHTEPNAGRMYINLQGGPADSVPHYDYQQHQQPQHENYGKPHYESAYPMGNMPNYGGGYPGQQQQQQQMQYGGQSGYPSQPQQNMQIQEPQQQGSKCCGLCVVM